MKITDFKTKRQRDRFETLLPGGIPKKVRIYEDQENNVADRFTCVFTGNYTSRTGGQHWYIGFSGAPFHPQGIGHHGESDHQIDVKDGSWGGVSIGKKCHLGTRIQFEDLNDDGKQFVMQNYLYLWDFVDDDYKPIK